MTKKKYLKPALIIVQAEAEQIVAASVTVVQTNGLDDNLIIDENSTEDNTWEFAW